MPISNKGCTLPAVTQKRAAELLLDGAQRVSMGLIWVVTANDEVYRTVRQVASSHVGPGDRSGEQLVYDVHPLYRDAERWEKAGLRLLLNTAAQLRDHTVGNPRKRKDVLGLFTPLIAVVDPDLSFCRKWGDFDPAWVLRDLVSRLCVPDRQGAASTVVLTAAEPMAILPSTLRRALAPRDSST